MWKEQYPKVNDTVKVNLILPNETVIGVVDYISYINSKVVVDIGSRRLYMDPNSTFFVWNC